MFTCNFYIIKNQIFIYIYLSFEAPGTKHKPRKIKSIFILKNLPKQKNSNQSIKSIFQPDLRESHLFWMCINNSKYEFIGFN